MTYKEQLEEAEKAKALESLNPTFHKWGRKGERVLGEFVERIVVVSSRGTGEYNQYLFRTDEGLVKFALGAATDKEIGNALVKGEVYLVVFEGQEKIAGGRSINRFLISHIARPEGVVGSDEDMPF